MRTPFLFDGCATTSVGSKRLAADPVKSRIWYFARSATALFTNVAPDPLAGTASEEAAMKKGDAKEYNSQRMQNN